MYITNDEISFFIQQHNEFLKDDSKGMQFSLDNIKKFYNKKDDHEIKFADNLDLSNKNLYHANFQGIIMHVPNFSNSDCTNVDFRYSDISFANFSNTTLINSIFYNSTIFKANFDNTDLRDVIGDGKIIKNILLEKYIVYWCENGNIMVSVDLDKHSLDEWKNNNITFYRGDDEKWWNDRKDHILSIIELSFIWIISS